MKGGTSLVEINDYGPESAPFNGEFEYAYNDVSDLIKKMTTHIEGYMKAYFEGKIVPKEEKPNRPKEWSPYGKKFRICMKGAVSEIE